MLLISSCCKTSIILITVKNLVICWCSRCVSSSCNYQLWWWCIDLSKNSLQIWETVWELFSFSCYVKVCHVSHCWMHSSHSDSAMKLLFFLCYFIQCIFFSVMSCKVVFIDLYLWAFIWMSDIELQAFIMFCKCSNMMNFNILLNVLNNAIDLYIFALE